MEILIPERFTENFGDSINLITKILIEINSHELKELVINFNSNKFITPFALGGLLAIVNNLKIKGIFVNLKYDKNITLTQYFNAIHFPNGIDLDKLSVNEIEKELDSYGGKTFFPLVLFPTGINSEESNIRENALSALNTLLKTKLKLSGHILVGIYHLIDELTNNIADHSRSQKGIILTQFYPTKNYLDVCIVDYGRGILQTYLDSGIAKPETHQEAIELAINGKSTKDNAISRGFGISTSTSLLTSGLKGKIAIYSGNAIFHQNNQDKVILGLPNKALFEGCLINLRIPTLEIANFNIHDYTQ